MSYALVMTTTSNLPEAEGIAQALLRDRWAACIQVMPITSYYTWQGEYQREGEYLLLIKAKAAHFAQIQATIQANHSYQVPEIIQIPIVAGFDTYLEWISVVTGK